MLNFFETFECGYMTCRHTFDSVSFGYVNDHRIVTGNKRVLRDPGGGANHIGNVAAIKIANTF